MKSELHRFNDFEIEVFDEVMVRYATAGLYTGLLYLFPLPLLASTSPTLVAVFLSRVRDYPERNEFAAMRKMDSFRVFRRRDLKVPAGSDPTAALYYFSEEAQESPLLDGILQAAYAAYSDKLQRTDRLIMENSRSLLPRGAAGDARHKEFQEQYSRIFSASRNSHLGRSS